MHLQLIEAIRGAERPATPTPPGVVGHDVQFYASESFLTRVVAQFLADGIRAGQPLIVIATAPHRAAVIAALRRQGLDVDQMFSDRLAIWLDARETLAAFMEGPRPSPELFMATIGRVFEHLLHERPYLVVRGYGEMVDLLARDGNLEGADQVERLWNELASTYDYSLLCAYSLDNFLHDAGMEGARRVCEHHAHVLSLESPHLPSA